MNENGTLRHTFPRAFAQRVRGPSPRFGPDGAFALAPGESTRVPLAREELASLIGPVAAVSRVERDVPPVPDNFLSRLQPARQAPDREPKRVQVRRVEDCADDTTEPCPQTDVTGAAVERASLGDFVSTLTRHPEGSAILQRIREVCGTTPANTAILRELDYYVNQTRKHPVQPWMLGGGIVGAGDVTGPATSTDNAIARYDGTTGKVIQNSAVRIDDSGNMEGGANLTISAQLRSGDGDATKPGQAFKGDDGTGMFRGSTPALGFSVGGSQQLLLRGHHGLDHILTGNTTLQGNLLIDGDVTADNLTLTNPLPITQGGTGASTADGAIQNLTNGATSRTPVLTDQIPFYDVGTAGGKVTPQALYNLINSLTAESSPATGDKLPLYDASAGQADAVTFGNLVGIGKMIMFGYTGNGTSGRTVTLTGINRCYLIMVQRVGTSGSDDYRYPFGIPMGGTGAQSAMYTDGQWFGGFSFGAQSAGSSQVLTINSTAAEVNANGASYRLVAFGTPV